MATKTMSRTEELVRANVDYFNDRELDEGQRHVTADFEWTVVPFDKSYRGPKGYRESMQLWIDAFPDARCEITRVIAQGNFVVVEFRGKGTHNGALEGPQGKIAPSGKRVDLPLVDVYEFKDDKVCRGRTYFDAATMLRQLGVKP